MQWTKQLTCRNPFDKMKVGGVFQYDLKELQYDCDKRYSHEERDIFNYKRLCLLSVCLHVSERVKLLHHRQCNDSDLNI